MKKTLLLLGFAALLASCSKDKKDDAKHCWTCKVAVTYTPDMGANSTIDQEVCDRTEAEIRQYEKAGTVSQTVNNNGMTITQSAVTTCTQK